jgi:hypothetical protein
MDFGGESILQNTALFKFFFFNFKRLNEMKASGDMMLVVPIMHCSEEE